MAERKAVTKQLSVRYAKAGKAGKGRMLTELCELTGWSRDHARRALRRVHAPPPTRPRKPRTPVYGEETIEALRKVWSVFGFLCGKRLAPFMAEAIEVLERCGEITLTRAVRRQLRAMSASTIDRRLRADRKRFEIKGRKGTKPGTLLKAQIPIRTFADWDEARPGFFEADLVSHDGGVLLGECCQTLMLTCVNSTWIEPRALPKRPSAGRRTLWPRSPRRCPLPCSASTPTTGRSSSTGTCTATARRTGFSSRAAGRTRKTTSSKR
jgi:hypothetical protein